MRFNPDPKKQTQEVILSRKINKIDHPLLYFNQNLVKSSSNHKHLRMVLDTKLDFSLHLKNIQNKVDKTIGNHFYLLLNGCQRYKFYKQSLGFTLNVRILRTNEIIDSRL